MESVIIPNSVTFIGNYAFANCSSLSSITIPSNVRTLGNDAFQGCSGLTQIICKAKVSPSITYSINNDTFFEGVDKATCTLYVPACSIDAYADANGWWYFTRIEPVKEPIEPIVKVNTEITERNAIDITEFKMKVESGATLTINEEAKAELWIDGALKGTASAEDIREKGGTLTVTFSSSTKEASTRAILDEFWKTVATSTNNDVQILVKVAAASFKIDGEDLDEELCYSYNAKASVAESIVKQITSLEELKIDDNTNSIIYNLNGSRNNDSSQKGIIIKNGSIILVK